MIVRTCSDYGTIVRTLSNKKFLEILMDKQCDGDDLYNMFVPLFIIRVRDDGARRSQRRSVQSSHVAASPVFRSKPRIGLASVLLSSRDLGSRALLSIKLVKSCQGSFSSVSTLLTARVGAFFEIYKSVTPLHRFSANFLFYFVQFFVDSFRFLQNFIHIVFVVSAKSIEHFSPQISRNFAGITGNCRIAGTS